MSYGKDEHQSQINLGNPQNNRKLKGISTQHYIKDIFSWVDKNGEEKWAGGGVTLFAL